MANISTTIQNIIDQAEQIAVGMGTDPNQSTAIDSEMTAEDLLPLAFRHAYLQLLNSGSLSLQDVMLAHQIEVTDGEGILPDGVLTEHLDNSFLPAFPFSSWMRYFADYSRKRFDNLLCYYTVNNGKFYTTCGFNLDSSGEVEDSSGAESSEEGEMIELHAPSIPAMPTLATTTFEMPQRALDAVVNTLALALRGEIRLAQ
jgi:hypothetical protein